MVEVLILATIMVWRDPKLLDKAFWAGVLKIVSVTGFSVLAGFFIVTLYPLGANDTGFITLGSKLALIAGVIFSVHFTLSLLFGLEEAQVVLRRIKRIVLKAR